MGRNHFPGRGLTTIAIGKSLNSFRCRVKAQNEDQVMGYDGSEIIYKQ
jgi:hypothetical protein